VGEGEDGQDGASEDEEADEADEEIIGVGRRRVAGEGL